MRRAWDLHDPWVVAHLDTLLRRLVDAGFAYLKLDYSDTLGSRIAWARLARTIRSHPRRAPGRSHVIQLVAAGSGRMEASLLQRISLALAAALHKLVLPC
jgi:hypothetical protein